MVEGKNAILIVYVDDIIVTDDDLQEIKNLKKQLKTKFEMKDLGVMRYFLGVEVGRSKEGLFISQRKYTLNLLKEIGMLACKLADTPLEKGWNVEEKEDTLVEKERYQSLVGRLIYLSLTRPDIAYGVSVISQYMHSPTQKHINAVFHVLRYLKGMPGKGLMFKKINERRIECFVDTNWAGSCEDNRSTSSYYTKLWSNVVTWRSKKQSVVARSCAKAKFCAITQGICEVISLERMMKDLGISLSQPTEVYSDSKSAISIVKNPIQHNRMKHIRINRSFIKKEIEEGGISLSYIPTTDQVANVFTKAVARPEFKLLIGELRMTCIYSST